MQGMSPVFPPKPKQNQTSSDLHLLLDTNLLTERKAWPRHFINIFSHLLLKIYIHPLVRLAMNQYQQPGYFFRASSYSRLQAKNISSHTELPVPSRHPQGFFAKPFPPLLMGLAAPRDCQPHSTDQADAQGHISCIYPGRGMRPKEKLGMRQDGFLPLLHSRSVSYSASFCSGGKQEKKKKKPNSKQPKECQNDKHRSRRGLRDTLPVSVLTQQEWSLG